MGLIEATLLSPYVLVAHSLIRGRSILHFLPSLSWLTLMVIPFLYSKEFFSNRSILIQYLGILIFSLAFVLGDRLSSAKRYAEKVNASLFVQLHSRLKILDLILLAIISLVPLLTFLINGNLPILTLISEREFDLEVAESRRLFTKVETPYFLSILGNWTTVLFGPILIARIMTHRHHLLSFSVFLWIGLFALSSSAKGPFTAFLLTILIIIAFKFKEEYKKQILIISLLSILSIPAISISFLSTVQNHHLTCQLPPDVPRTPANALRVCAVDDKSLSSQIGSYLTYRVFLTPVEVSNNWYQEYSSGRDYRELAEVFNSDWYSDAANEIGIKYYYNLFPSRYTKDVSAYGSIDADAFSFGGIFSLLCVSIALFLLRLVVSHLSTKVGKEYLNALSISMLVYFPISASIQALLFSQGLGVLLAMLLVYTLLLSRRRDASIN
jgi:hypothetical protein